MIYADSSVVVKRYHEEPGTGRVRERWAGEDRIFTSWITYPEVHAALARKHREGWFSAAVLSRLAGAFELEWVAYDHIAVSGATLAEVRRLLRRHPLRGGDAVHLAAAAWLREQIGDPLEFWVSDARLESAARREGLTVVNPEAVSGKER